MFHVGDYLNEIFRDVVHISEGDVFDSFDTQI